MPEGLEVEIYRRTAERLVGRTIVALHADARRSDPGLATAMVGSTFDAAKRVGKLLMLETDGPTLGVHFGMTGRLVVDGVAAIAELEYGSGRDDSKWDRLVVELADGGQVRVNDPRRWARFTLDPDATVLGPDVLSLTLADLEVALRGTSRSVKAVLLDQRRVAGLGNMCVDEVLWHAALAPQRWVTTLGHDDVAGLHAALREQLPAMLERGGSHAGVLSPDVRASLSPCAADGRALARAHVAGRTTVWCPHHQPSQGARDLAHFGPA